METLPEDDCYASANGYKAIWCLHLASSMQSDGRLLGAQLAEDIWPCGSWPIAATSFHASGQRSYRTVKDRRRRHGTMAEHQLSRSERHAAATFDSIYVVWMSEIQWYLHSHVPGYNAGARVLLLLLLYTPNNHL